MSMLNDTDIQPNQGTYIARLDRAVDRLTNLVREAQYYFEVESQRSITDCMFSMFILLVSSINWYLQLFPSVLINCSRRRSTQHPYVLTSRNEMWM